MNFCRGDQHLVARPGPVRRDESGFHCDEATRGVDGGYMRRYHAALELDQARLLVGQLVILKPRRIVEPDGPGNRSQPIRSQADATQSAADSRR